MFAEQVTYRGACFGRLGRGEGHARVLGPRRLGRFRRGSDGGARFFFKMFQIRRLGHGWRVFTRIRVARLGMIQI